MRRSLPILGVFSLALCLVLSTTQQASAEELSLKISPPLIKIQATPPANIRTAFTIENQGNDTLDMQISYKIFQASGEYGQIEYRQQHDFADDQLLKKVQIVDNEGFAIDTLSLGPKQKKTLELRLALTQNEPVDDYYFSVTFLNKSKQTVTQTEADSQKTNNASFLEAGIAMNVLLTIGPNEKQEGALEEFSAPFYLESGPVPFSVRMKNVGNHIISPKGTILITNMFGQTIGKVELPETNILTGTIRSLNNGLTDPKEKISHAQPKALWSEKFLLGFYTANITLSLGENSPIYTKAVHFIAFPIKFIRGFLITLTLLFIIFIRLKKKLKNA